MSSFEVKGPSLEELRERVRQATERGREFADDVVVMFNNAIDAAALKIMESGHTGVVVWRSNLPESRWPQVDLFAGDEALCTIVVRDQAGAVSVATTWHRELN